MAQGHGVYLPTGSSIYYCSIQVLGKRKCASTKCRSKKDAIAFARRWKASLIGEAEAERAADPQMKFLPAVNRYMKEVGEHFVTRDQFENFFDWLVDRIGADTPISAIDNDMVAKLMSERAAEPRWGREGDVPVAMTYVQRAVLVPLRAVLKRAKELWEIRLPREPIWGKHRIKFRPRTRVMSWDEEAAIKAVAGDDLWPLIEFILLTGLRRRDALINWSNIDRAARVIRTTVKGDSPFEVRITPGIQRLLDSAADAGTQTDAVWTWVPSYGAKAGVRQPIDYQSFARLWAAATERAGVQGLTIHDLRRTAGERLYRATNDIYAVSVFLGHANVEITRSYYLHVKPDQIEERQLAMEWVRSKTLEQHAKRPRRR